MKQDEFFVGYLDTPKRDRRFFLKAGLGLLAGTAALSAGLAGAQMAPGLGQWDQGAIRDWYGIVTNTPYAILRTSDINGVPMNVPLSCLGKCGVAARLSGMEGEPVIITGSLIQRGPHAMIAVNENGPWIKRADSTVERLAFQPPQPIGDVALSGMIVDTKCWFGAMRPSEGKVHKACAALCIRGGLPPAFLVKDKTRQALLIMTHNGQAHGEDILPYVADPISVKGTANRFGNLLFLDSPVSAFTRL